MKIFAVYQGGLGAGFMVEMNIKRTLVDLGVDVDDFEVSRMGVGSVSSDMTDYLFIGYSLKDTLTSVPDEKLMPLQLIIDSDKVKEKVEQILSEE